MQFQQLYSSSHGNLYLVTAQNGDKLLIECGVRWRPLQDAIGFHLKGISACLLTHEHKDHSQSVDMVLASGIDVYASQGTFDNLYTCINLPIPRRGKVISDKTLLRLDSFDVLSFFINHDAKEPLGFAVRAKQENEYLLYATDTAYLAQKFDNIKFNIIAIECSYDKAILEQRVADKTINEVLAKRLLLSHMEKSNTMRYLKEFCDLSKCREIHLLHCSADNLDKEQTRKEFETEFMTKVVIK